MAGPDCSLLIPLQGANQQSAWQCCYISVASILQRMKLIRYSDHKHSLRQHDCLLWSSGFQRGGERHPPIPGTLTINSTEEELQGLQVKESCMNMNRLVTATALWYGLQVPTKNSQQKRFLCTSCLGGGAWWKPSFGLPISQSIIISHHVFRPRQENLEGYIFY